MSKRRRDDEAFVDFRAAFLASYERRRRAINHQYEVRFSECEHPAEELAIALHTASGHIIHLWLNNDRNVAASILRVQKPTKGLVRCFGSAINADLLLEALLETASTAYRIDGVQFAHEQRDLLREIWKNACISVDILF